MNNETTSEQLAAIEELDNERKLFCEKLKIKYADKWSGKKKPNETKIKGKKV